MKENMELLIQPGHVCEAADDSTKTPAFIQLTKFEISCSPIDAGACTTNTAPPKGTKRTGKKGKRGKSEPKQPFLYRHRGDLTFTLLPLKQARAANITVDKSVLQDS
jgi:hypothetical protein